MNKKSQPPKLADRLLSWFCKPELLEEIQGDLQADFERRCQSGSHWKANIRYWLQVLNFIRPFALKQTKMTNNMDMLKNHFKIAIRTILRQKEYSAINLIGLAIGMSCFILISLYVQDEISYDRFHRDSERIVRVVRDRDQNIFESHVSPGLRTLIDEKLPEIDASTRIVNQGEGLLSHEDQALSAKGLRVDHTFFEIFTFDFIHGNPETALDDPEAVILTETLSRKFFGDVNPIGKTMSMQRMGPKKPIKVSAVIRDVPSQSHFTFDFISLFRPSNHTNTHWGFGGSDTYHTYVKLAYSSEPYDLQDKIQTLVDQAHPERNVSYSLQPLSGLNGIHLSSNRLGELQVNNDLVYIKLLLAIACFVVFIGAINYINLSTARSAVRAKEIGVRKVIGAGKQTLFTQFMVESVLLSFLASVLAVVLTTVCLPFLNELVSKDLVLFSEKNRFIWLLILGATCLIGLISGVYPALYLSRLKSDLAFKGRTTLGKIRFGLRQSLVIVQFGLAVFLLIGIFVVNDQLDHIQKVDLGIHKEHMIIVSDFHRAPRRDKGGAIRNEIRALANVVGVGAGRELGAIQQGGATDVNAIGSTNTTSLTVMDIDHHYLEVFGLQFKQGRNFSPSFPADSIEDSRIIINETAANQLGLEEPYVGQKLNFKEWGNYESTVIGVVEDFHFRSLHSKIKPIGFVWEENANALAIRMNGQNVHKTLSEIEDIWLSYVPGIPFDFYFLDEAIDKQYHAERTFKSIFSIMTALSIGIACLGLFGLATFITKQRTKEVGIRKVLGATVFNLIRVLTREFAYLIVISNLIAWPLAYLMMQNWLENFAYRIEIGWLMFPIIGAIALSIALLTVGLQTYRAAIANPVNSLRDE